MCTQTYVQRNVWSVPWHCLLPAAVAVAVAAAIAAAIVVVVRSHSIATVNMCLQQHYCCPPSLANIIFAVSIRDIHMYSAYICIILILCLSAIIIKTTFLKLFLSRNLH